MLPFLVAGGLIAGLGKLIYDVVKDDDSSSSSSGGGGPDEEARKAREQQRKAVRQKLGAELLARTSTDVGSILEAHKGVVTGKAKTPMNPVVQVVVRSAIGYPFPTGGSPAGSASDARGLSMEDLQDLARMEGKESGFDALKKMTSELKYAVTHVKDEKWIERMSSRRDALIALAEKL